MPLLTIALVGGVTTGVIATASYAIMRWKGMWCYERRSNPYVNIYDDQEEFFYYIRLTFGLALGYQFVNLKVS